MTIYLEDAIFIDWKSLEIFKTHIAVREGVKNELEMVESLPDRQLMAPGDSIINCENKYVTKSFGCGHHHIYSALARGMPAPKRPPQNFLEILLYVWWNLDKNLDLKMIKASALVTALYCAKNGVTFVIDHHSSPFAVEGSLNTIKEAFDAVGISHLLCYEISDRDGEPSMSAGLSETEDFLKSGNQGLVGLHASMTVNGPLLKKAVELAVKYDSGIHVHVAEDKSDQEQCRAKYNKRVIERFSKAGMLDLSKTILGHCIHLNYAEKSIVKESAAWVAENVESNLNNNVGLADYSEYGGNIFLGTDGMHSDMLRSAQAAFFAGQATEGVSIPSIYQRFRNIHHYLKQNRFEGDGNNNLVILDYNPPTPLTADNFLGHFVFGLNATHVESVISNGKMIVKNGQLITMDEQEILSFSREQAVELWKRL